MLDLQDLQEKWEILVLLELRVQLVSQDLMAFQAQKGKKEAVESLSLDHQAWMEHLDQEEIGEKRDLKDFQAQQVIAIMVLQDQKVTKDPKGLRGKMAQRGLKVPKVKLVLAVQPAPKVLQGKKVLWAPQANLVTQEDLATLDLKVTQGILDHQDAVDVMECQVSRVILVILELLDPKAKRERLSEW